MIWEMSELGRRRMERLEGVGWGAGEELTALRGRKLRKMEFAPVPADTEVVEEWVVRTVDIDLRDDTVDPDIEILH